MKTRFYFVHNNADRKLMSFMRNQSNPSILIFTQEQYKTYAHQPDEDPIVIYHNDSSKNTINRKNTNILLLMKPMFDTTIIDRYDFFLPITPTIYHNMYQSIGTKVLLPIPCYEGKPYRWGTYYCGDLTFRRIKSVMSRTGLTRQSIAKCNMALYDDVNELSKITSSNPISKHYTDHLPQSIRFLKMINKCTESKKILLQYKINNIRVKNYSNNVTLKKNNLYLISRYGFDVFKRFKFHIVANNYLAQGINSVCFYVEGKTDPEFALLVLPQSDITDSPENLLKTVEYFDYRAIGANSKVLSEPDVYELYRIYGTNEMRIHHLEGIQHIYMDVLVAMLKNVRIISNQALNKNKFIRVVGYWSGKNDNEIKYKLVKRYVRKHPEFFEQKEILLLSKKIVSYGGNQKTALQLYKELQLEGFDVKIGCVTPQSLVSVIDRMDIIKLVSMKRAYEEAIKDKYHLVIVNKLDQLLDYCGRPNDKIIFISHNSMDPVNQKLKQTNIQNSKGFFNKIRKILTVNQHHISNLYDGKLTVPVTDYGNYHEIYHGKIVRNPDNAKKPGKMSHTITYVGRLSHEKNVNMLIDSFLELTLHNKNIKLVIIGDGKKIRYERNPQIIYTGRLDHDGIVSWLARSDFLVSTTCTEGLPYSYLESMSMGVPVISPGIVGCVELIKHMKNGIIYDFYEYEYYKNRNDWNVFEHVAKHHSKNVNIIKSALETAFSMDIESWNELSNNCFSFYQKYYNSRNLSKYNLNSVLMKNNMLIISDDIDPFFKKQFPFFDTSVTSLNNTNKKYDIVVEVDSFDVFAKRLSLLKTPKMAHRNIANMNCFMNRVYKLRRECREKDIYRVIEKLSNVSISFPTLKEKIIAKDQGTKIVERLHF